MTKISVGEGVGAGEMQRRVGRRDERRDERIRRGMEGSMMMGGGGGMEKGKDGKIELCV